MSVADTRRLPVPVVEVWDWQLQGACRGMDSAVFFHPEGERGQARADREERAKQVCLNCPVLRQCRRHALLVREPYGVWGGLSASEREHIVRSRDRTLRIPGTLTTHPHRSRPATDGSRCTVPRGPS